VGACANCTISGRPCRCTCPSAACPQDHLTRSGILHRMMIDSTPRLRATAKAHAIVRIDDTLNDTSSYSYITTRVLQLETASSSHLPTDQ